MNPFESLVRVLTNVRVKLILSFIFVLLILFIPCANLTVSDLGDSFYALNLYRFLERGAESITLPIFMSAIVGHWLLCLADFFNVGDIIWLRILAILSFWLMSALVYILYSDKVGKLTILAGLVVAACFYKSCLTIVYYTQLSQVIFVLFAIFLLASREKQSSMGYVVCGFVAVFAVSIRITNVAFFSLLLLLFIKDKENVMQWKKFISCFSLGALFAVVFIALVVHFTIGWPLLYKMPEAIGSTSVDGHTPLMLPLYIAYGLIGPRGISLCVLCLIAFALTYGAVRIWYRLRDLRWLSVVVVLGAFLFLLWSCGCVHLLLFDDYVDYALNLGGKVHVFSQSVFLWRQAIAFFIWVNVFLIVKAIMRQARGSEIRLLVASLLVCLMGPFGSNTQLMPVIYASYFIVPIIFYGIKKWVLEDYALFSIRFREKKLCMISVDMALLLVMCAISLSAPLYAMTYSFLCPKIPLTSFFKKPDFLHPVRDLPRLRGTLFFESDYKYLQSCVDECSSHVPEGAALIDISGPCANYVLNAPPVLKWRGGDTRYTTPESLRSQLNAMPIRPYILVYRWSKCVDDKIKVVEKFTTRNYDRVETSNFVIWKPIENS